MGKQFDECMLERDLKKRKNDKALGLEAQRGLMKAYWRAFPMGKEGRLESPESRTEEGLSDGEAEGTRLEKLNGCLDGMSEG
jgi:hypothetical protein